MLPVAVNFNPPLRFYVARDERERLGLPLRGCDPPAGADENGWIWGTGDQMQTIARLVDQIADSDVTVLVRGESGVGKEFVARAIHQRSTRRAGPFVKVNCAALPADLLESELFGHERGAFTGAATTRVGKFEQADKGTLMLDEIGEMSPSLQAKLLHVLQDGEFTRLGSNRRFHTAVRVIAATNRDLERMRTSGEFREDLYYRLQVIELTVPPLRERREEIPAFVDFFVERCSRKYHRPNRPLSVELRQALSEYDWPGNVRELDNLIRRVVVLQDEQPVMRELRRNVRRAFPPQAPVESCTADANSRCAARVGAVEASVPTGPTLGSRSADPTDPRVESLVALGKAAALQAERVVILQTLSRVQWNRRKAAQILGVSYKTLLNKIKEGGISQG